MSISRIFTSLAVTVDSLSSVISTGSTLIDQEFQALKESRRASHAASYLFETKDKFSNGASNSAITHLMNETRCSKKGEKTLKKYNDLYEEGLQYWSDMNQE